jgi:pimeloyl-ACP methyl ester carboxylesterase
MWIYNARALSEHFRIYAVDTIGGPGKSEPNAEYFKAYDQIRWIDELLDALKIERTYAAGVSNGAYLTTHYFIKRPERVIRAVCMSGAGGGSMLRMLAFVPAALFPTERNIKKLLKKLCGPNTAGLTDNAEILRHWEYLLKYFNTRSMMYQKTVRFKDEELKTLSGRALFLIGESDGLIKLPGDLEKLERNHIGYKVIKNAGHALNHQQPELINREIVDFLLKA